MKYFLSFGIFLSILISSQSVTGQSTSDSLKTASIKVSGITCNGDMPIIKKKLINLEGTESVTFTEAKNGVVTFTVEYHTSVITEERILKEIEAAPSCDNPNSFPYKTKPLSPRPKNQ